MSQQQQQETVVIPNLIQQLQRLHNHNHGQLNNLQHNTNGEINLSSNSSLENNIDSFENRRRISLQDQIQQNQSLSESNRSSRQQAQNNQQNQIENQSNNFISHVSQSTSENDHIRPSQDLNNSTILSSVRSNQQQSQIKRAGSKGICNSILQFLFNYSLQIYLICNLIVIINQFISKSNRNFTLLFWTITSVLFILIRLVQTCLMYQRESDDFSNLMRIPPSSRQRINRRSRLNRLYPRRQTNRSEIPIPINQIIQQLYQNNHPNDVENQNLERNNDFTEFGSTFLEQNMVQNESNIDASIQQIWLESFRQQMAQQGVNTNVMIRQQRIQQQQAKGLSKEQIKKLEKISYTQEQLNQLSEHDNLCSICLEKYECDKKLIKLPCSHTYHNYCITKWLQQDYKCPLCRQYLRSNP